MCIHKCDTLIGIHRNKGKYQIITAYIFKKIMNNYSALQKKWKRRSNDSLIPNSNLHICNERSPWFHFFYVGEYFFCTFDFHSTDQVHYAWDYTSRRPEEPQPLNLDFTTCSSSQQFFIYTQWFVFREKELIFSLSYHRGSVI